MSIWQVCVRYFVLKLFINIVGIPITGGDTKNVEPNIILTRNNYFDLNIDKRYHFKPGFATSPFSSVGEPWPLPKHFKQDGLKLLHLQKWTFQIIILNKNPCDILDHAVERYKNIINKYITEEHYHSPFNFNEDTLKNRKQAIEQKYSNISKMPDLEITVIKDHCGYPHLRMNESYRLHLSSDSAQLIAHEVWGALRGLETFSQLLFRKQNTDEVYAKVTDVVDKPRFPHRGVLIDTARHFIYKNTIKDVLDGMAYNKLNVLHWHIVDDSSFPYKSEVFPKLSEKAAYHPTLVYSLSDIREIVEFARLRGIRVIPEFDTPAHSFSWFGYPDIVSNCYMNNQNLGPLGPINPATNQTYEFMAKLFNEIFDVFPDEYVHLGGDEVVSTCWSTNPAIKAYLQTYAGIPMSEAFSSQSYIGKTMSYYFNRLIPILQSIAREKKQHKEFVLWEDVLKGSNKVPQNSVIQIWTGSPDNKVKLVNRLGRRAIFSACWYLSGYTKHEWFDLYNCDPSPYASEAEEKDNVLGGEVCLWSEFISTDSLLTTMWPRTSLPAERLWSPVETKDINSAASRLHEQRCRMIYRGLATGQISGPDYCLRPDDSPLWKRSQRSMEEAAIRFNKTMKYRISDCKHLPVGSVLLSLIGLLLWVTLCKKISFRKRNPLRYNFT